MRLLRGLLRGLLLRVPAHAFEVHHCHVVVFGVAADAALAGAVVEFAAFVFDLINYEALTKVSAVDDDTFGHGYLASSSLIKRTS